MLRTDATWTRGPYMRINFRVTMSKRLHHHPSCPPWCYATTAGCMPEKVAHARAWKFCGVRGGMWTSAARAQTRTDANFLLRKETLGARERHSAQ